MATEMTPLIGLDARGVHLAPFGEADPRAVEHLLDLSFGVDRHQRTAYRLRDGIGCAATESCVAFADDGMLVGSLQTWPLGLFGADGPPTRLWLVGPIAVHPDHRNEGIGRGMLRRALAAIDITGIPAVLIGDPEYYEPFGFSAAATGEWVLPGPVERHRLLARIDGGVKVPACGTLGPRY